MQGGLLDEERVNRLRYLEGTPKASTRWIDTGVGDRGVEAGQRRSEGRGRIEGSAS